MSSLCVSLVAFRRARLCALLAPAALVALCGCTSIKVHLGMRAHIDKIPVTTIDATLPNGSAIAPGEKAPLVVTFTTADGKTWVTEGKGKGKILWSDLTVTPTLVTFKKGVLALRHDPRVSQGLVGHVDIAVPSHPGLHASLDIPLTYAYPFKASYAGASGSDGANGQDGASGIDGSPGSTDPNNPSAGGNGSDGSDGSNGQDGDNGGPGPDVQVYVTVLPGAHPLLQAGVVAAGHHERFYLVDPAGGSLTISSNGGAGGSGGKGGSGGRGGSGGIGTPNGNSGRDGSDGRSGLDGSAGSGGRITITYDPQVQPYLSAIKASNPGGPKPVWQQQPVAPLW